MDNCDFSFRGETLSSHGYMLCEFDGASSAGVVTTDSQRLLTQMSMFGGRQLPILYYTYGESLILKIEICKRSDSELEITPGESAKMKRWLESPTPQKFKLLEADYANYFWSGTFNVEEIRMYDMIVGLSLTFTTVAPFGYKEEVSYSGTVAQGGTVTVESGSDEEGFIYPDIKITLQSNGNLTITNSFDGRETIINGCTNGEVITISKSLQLFTSNASHDIYNDFNYKFLRIHNDYDNDVNDLTFNLPCRYEIVYNPIAKVVFS